MWWKRKSQESTLEFEARVEKENREHEERAASWSVAWLHGMETHSEVMKVQSYDFKDGAVTFWIYDARASSHGFNTWVPVFSAGLTGFAMRRVPHDSQKS